MRHLIVPLVVALLASPGAYATCTPDEVTAKAEQLAERVNQLARSDPQRAREINEEIREMQARRTADQLGDECQAYDKRLQQIEQAESKAQTSD
ncbi:hypothetical protein YO5_14301 [Stutzerimonas stutzeri TS44]|nr:hypothetical protein YO5_14301 [Stutzerimonas stutzeri TS44]